MIDIDMANPNYIPHARVCICNLHAHSHSFEALSKKIMKSVCTQGFTGQFM